MEACEPNTTSFLGLYVHAINSLTFNYRSSNRLLLLLMIEDVLHTDNERGRWKNFEPRRPLSTAAGSGILPSAVSGGKLTFRPAFELEGDIEFSSDIPNAL